MKTAKAGPAIWSSGDWNAFFGFGTNILVNMLTITALLRFVLKMPDSLVFGRILILMIGGFVAPLIRKITPRAALLGTLAGVSIAFISMRPAFEMYMTPTIGLTCFAIILISWFGGVRYPLGIPAGLVAIVVGAIIAWGSNLFGLNIGCMSAAKLGASLANIGFAVPIPAVGHVFAGFQFIGVILVTAIPFGVYDLVEAMNNVESAEAAGDEFPTTRVLTADGVV